MYGKGAKIILKYELNELIKIYIIFGSKLANKDLKNKNETFLFKLLAII